MLHQSRVAAEMTVACCIVEGMRGQVSFVLLQSLDIIERLVVENVLQLQNRFAHIDFRIACSSSRSPYLIRSD